ncbi:NADPH:quinone oxidoreductase [Paenibacillus baekrokdamisoli]|uniref:NADPH:quinone oxidoreductase n=1 Tax=Paenibacillus baekrokdamisoli TaxID=1712516 RepID=A0A3G9JNQ0_9BACL|nr:NAD(P)-dependent alcohol dehydrogenase [Paenibacillus baekrokdamisoli]MBB3071485.1 NADPH:quinone reductase-like Zn-dependent oxidoreductase [Paenibacillus baekrokdamisoli]BBH24484.1 NADPH:quinone oxidoreductase [Paenibacillus baekrokdamisoli]
MRAFEIQNGFGLSHVVAVERPKPTPGPGEVLIKIHAVALNARDLGVINGVYNPNLQHPLIPTSDGVGVVVALGEQTSRFKIGDRVSGIFVQGWITGDPSEKVLNQSLGSPLDGMLAEYTVLHEDGLVHVPEHLTDEEVASLPCAGVTAWHAIVTEGKVKAGDTVVVQGTGGVSLFALQFAKLHGAAVIVTSSSDEKLKQSKKLGADYGINYRDNPDWDKEIWEWTSGRGVDHVIELGGASTLNRSVASVRFGGQVSLIGLLSGHTVDGFNIMHAFRKKVRLQGINVGNRDMFEAMNRAISQNKLRPVIDRVFPFEESVEALRYLAEGSYFGKICIKL